MNEKTVIRGGYGIFWAPQIYLGGPIATPGYANITHYTGTYAQSKDGLTNPFPSGLLAPLGNSKAQMPASAPTSLVDPKTKSP